MATFGIKAQRKNDSRETRNDKQRSDTVNKTPRKIPTTKKEVKKQSRLKIDIKNLKKTKYKAGTAEVDPKEK